MRFLTAVGFLTIIPVPRREEPVEQMVQAAAYYPLVGCLLGGILAGAAYGATFLWPSAAVAIIVVVCWAAVTGSLHLDGLADTADGFGGGYTPERRREIMRDVHAGTFAVVAVICVLALKIAFVGSLRGPRLLKALVVAPALGRWLQVALIAAFPTARTDGMAATFKQHLRPRDLAVATVTAIGVCAAAYGVWGLVLVAGTAALGWAGGVIASRRLGGGLTGDIYGAFCEAAEVLALAVLAMPWRVAFL